MSCKQHCLLSIFFFHLPVIFSSQPITVYSHGFLSNGDKAYKYKDKQFIFNKVHAFNFNDAESPRSTCLAGKDDVQKLSQAVQDLLEHHQKVEIFGVSRGAATACKYVAMADQTEQAAIAALIVESPFARYADITRNIGNHAQQTTRDSVGLLSWCVYPVTWLTQTSFSFTSDQAADNAMKLVLPKSEPKPSPLDVVQNIPHSIPVLLFCSQEDTLIPKQSTERLYAKLKKTGHPKLHLFRTRHGKHAKMMFENKRACFLVLNAFRKYYGLPHFTLSPEFQNKADALFFKTQPKLRKAKKYKRKTPVEMRPLTPREAIAHSSRL